MFSYTFTVCLTVHFPFRNFERSFTEILRPFSLLLSSDNWSSDKFAVSNEGLGVSNDTCRSGALFCLFCELNGLACWVVDDLSTTDDVPEFPSSSSSSETSTAVFVLILATLMSVHRPIIIAQLLLSFVYCNGYEAVYDGTSE